MQLNKAGYIDNVQCNRWWLDKDKFPKTDLKNQKTAINKVHVVSVSGTSEYYHLQFLKQ